MIGCATPCTRGWLRDSVTTIALTDPTHLQLLKSKKGQAPQIRKSTLVDRGSRPLHALEPAESRRAVRTRRASPDCQTMRRCGNPTREGASVNVCAELVLRTRLRVVRCRGAPRRD